MKPFITSTLEPLEARIAPATLTFTDAGGDTATITTTKGTMADLVAAATFGDDGHLTKLMLGSVFRGSDVFITTAGGVGATVNVDTIDASTIDLRDVKVSGELRQVTVGDANLLTPALRLLEVKSLGVTESPESHVRGHLETLTIHGNLGGALFIDGGRFGSLGTAQIDDSLVGGETSDTGSILASGSIGHITVTHDLIGASGMQSGSIHAGGNIGQLTIGGAVLGGSGAASASISAAGLIVTATITGSVSGSNAADSGGSGSISAGLGLATLTINGPLTGGASANSGQISAGNLGIGFVKVGSGLAGGVGFQSGSIISAGSVREAVIGTTSEGMAGGMGAFSGSLTSAVSIVKATVHGNVSGGVGDNSGDIASAGSIGTVLIEGNLQGGGGLQSGAIGSLKAFGNVTVTGNLLGGSADSSGQIVSKLNIGSVTIGGNVTGGGGLESGAIGTLTSINHVTTGNLAGGVGPRSGVIFALGNLVDAKVGSITGGAGDFSGRIGVGGVLVGLEVDGSINGGVGQFSGTVSSVGTLRDLVVDGSINGFRSTQSVTPGFGNGSVIGNGAIISVNVKGGLVGGDASNSGSIYTRGDIQKASISGSLIGGAGDYSGSLFTLARVLSGDPPLVLPGGNIGSVTILGDLSGAGGNYSGTVKSGGTLGSITIGSPAMLLFAPVQPAGDPIILGAPSTGSIFGGLGQFSGSIYSQLGIGTVAIEGSAVGTADQSARISSGGAIQSVFIGGSVSAKGSYQLNDGGDRSGQISAVGAIGSVTVVGSLTGARGQYGASIGAASIGQVSIGGDVMGGLGFLSGSIFARNTDLGNIVIAGTLSSIDGTSTHDVNGAIIAQRNLRSLEVGEIDGDPGRPVIISAVGRSRPANAAQALAIGSVETHGSMSYARIQAGITFDGEAVNGDASIGRVEVSTDAILPGAWEGNDVVAGISAGGDGLYGTNDDSRIDFLARTRITSRIAEVIIHGTIQGAADTHGIVAERIVSIKTDSGSSVIDEDLDNLPFTDAGDVSTDSSGSTRYSETPPTP